MSAVVEIQVPKMAALRRERELARRYVKREMHKEVVASMWKPSGFHTRGGVGRIAVRRHEEPVTVVTS